MLDLTFIVVAIGGDSTFYVYCCGDGEDGGMAGDCVKDGQ